MKKNGTYLVPTLYLEDWFTENAERNQARTLIKAKAFSRPRGRISHMRLPAG